MANIPTPTRYLHWYCIGPKLSVCRLLSLTIYTLTPLPDPELIATTMSFLERLRAVNVRPIEAATSAQRARRVVRTVPGYGGDPSDGARPATESLMMAAAFGANGGNDIPSDTPEFKFIGADKFLTIPAALVGEGHVDERIVFRCKYIASRGLRELLEMASCDDDRAEELLPTDAYAVTMGAGRAFVEVGDALPPPAQVDALVEMSFDTVQSRTIPQLEAGGQARTLTPAEIDTLIGDVSARYELNIDARDLGKMRFCDDDAWEGDTVAAAPRGDFAPYTMLALGALNLAAVGNRPLAAMVRAYGVAFGLTPSSNSRLIVEYQFTLSRPTAEASAAVAQHMMAYVSTADLVQICAQILAIFGLQHLHKNHTFITGDAHMARTNDAYVASIRTVTDDMTRNEINQYREIYMRTAPHPFGLGQTYWFAQRLARAKCLALALDVRRDIAPPALQRASIVYAACREWAALPVGNMLNAQYDWAVSAVRNFIQSVGTGQPLYSELSRYYSDTARKEVPPEVTFAVDALLPFVYGFALVYHVSATGEKDGLALALSLQNVKRDYSAIATLLQDLWTAYRDAAMEMGLDNYIARAAQLAAQVQAVGAGGNANAAALPAP